MKLKLFGTISAEIKSDNLAEEIVISASEFDLEEGDFRHVGDGEYQYEALYIYHGNDVEISFQVINFKGDVSISSLNTSGKIDILEDNLSVEALDEEDDFS
jgi:hypothetical protein